MYNGAQKAVAIGMIMRRWLLCVTVIRHGGRLLDITVKRCQVQQAAGCYFFPRRSVCQRCRCRMAADVVPVLHRLSP